MTENNIDALTKQLAELQAALAESNKLLEPLQNEETEINSQEYQLKQAFQKQMDEIRVRRTNLQQKKYEVQVVVNQTSNAIQQAQSEINKAKEEEAKKKIEAEKAAREAERHAVLEKKLDLVTIGAQWREWAKEHQITAGHYITENRRVILADPMGLGKTLSSIVTADMAAGVTKDASDDNPYLGVEQEVFIPSQTVWTDKAIEAAKKNEWPFDGPLASRSVINKVPLPVDPQFVSEDNPWELPETNYEYEVIYQGRRVEVGSQAPYIQYDLKNKLLELGYLEQTGGKYETQIVDSVKRPVGKKILYFCPSPLLRNVLEEWRNWAPHRNVTYIGGMSKKEREFAMSFNHKLDDYVIICNYEAWRRDKALLDTLAEQKFDTIIIDEAHMVKDRKTSAYKGVKKVIDECQPEYVIPMTGTPILNRPQELFSILTLVNPKEFYEERDFLWKYCEEYWPDGSNNSKFKFKPGGLDLLAKKIGKNFLRRTKDQAGIILPEKTIMYHELDRDDENYADQAKAREHMKKYATIVIDANAGKAIQATVMIALLTRLRQIETWPAGIVQRDKVTKEVTLQLDVFESQKIDYIIRHEDEWEGLIPDVIEDERVIVFSQFKAPLHELKRRVESMGYKAAVFDGDTPESLRDEIRFDFDRSRQPEGYEPKYQVLLCNYKAAGVGLNLTGATQLITLDEEWNPGKREQAWDRIHRIGQTHNVTIHVIRTKNTVDTWLASIIDEKESVVGGFESAMIGVNDLKDALDTGLI